MNDAFLKLYKANGVLDDSGQKMATLPLHRACPDAKKCWAGYEGDSSLALDDWNKIQLPYIGPLYAADASRLAVVGINLHQAGGLMSLLEMGIHVQSVFLSGQKKVHFGVEEYNGTLFWHRLAAYAAILTRPDWTLSDGEVRLGGKPLADDLEALAGTMNSLALVEAVKCSPDWDHSTPNEPMWACCPSRYLKDEIVILAPRTVLILGKSVLGVLPFEMSQPVAQSGDGNVRLYRCETGWGKILVANVIHPTAPGGADGRLAGQLAELLASKKDRP